MLWLLLFLSVFLLSFVLFVTVAEQCCLIVMFAGIVVFYVLFVRVFGCLLVHLFVCVLVGCLLFA